jgi:segregation and condensation protein A
VSKSKPELKLVEDTGSQLQEEDLSIELPPQQSEMPFAVVEGEPMTQLPRDLYIPPDALQVFLTAFEGPLDLLLYLIRKQNLDILNIPIAEITRQYMQYIEVMADLQLELAGEYLLMAAMLAEIKSRMLLPRPPVAEGQEEEDPRAELVRRLQEYERFKKAAEDLDKLHRLERDSMLASAELEERKVVKLLPDVTLKEMLDAFRDVLSRAEKFAHHHISRERLSQRERMSDILARLQTVAFFEFRELFKPEEGRMGVTVTFIAILELMKEGLIEIVQAEAYAPIHVRTAQRHLKVVQGGVTASESADAENEAALAQPELAGENDIPDEDETPPADNAAIAVQAAVADVAAASSIAVDNIESDNAIADPGFVEAAVSEAIASTENAVETVAEVAATDEASVAAAVAEEIAAGEPVVVDEAAMTSAVAEEDVPPEFGPVDDAGAFLDPLEAQAADSLVEESVPPIADGLVGHAVTQAVYFTEETAVDTLSATEAQTIHTPAPAETIEAVDTTAPTGAIEAIETTEPAETSAAVLEIAAADPAESQTVEEHVIEEHEVQEHVVPEHVVEEHVVPDPVVEEHNSLAETTVHEDNSLAETAVTEENNSLTETAVAEENNSLAETTVVEEHNSLAKTTVVEEHNSLAETAVVDENNSGAEATAVEENNSLVETSVVEENNSLTETADNDDAETQVESEDIAAESTAQVEAVEREAASEFVVAAELAGGAQESIAQDQPAEVVQEFAAAAESAEAAEQFVAAVEPAEVVEEFAAAGERAEVVEEFAAAGEPAEAVEQFAAAGERAEIVEQFVAAVEPSEVVEDVAAQAETAGIADEHGVSSDLPAVHDADEQAQPVETTNVVVAEDERAIEPIEVAQVDTSGAVETVEVASIEETSIVVDDASARPVAAEQDETTSEQIADLSEPDVSQAGDSVTGAGSSDDNSDAEPSR